MRQLIEQKKNVFLENIRKTYHDKLNILEQKSSDVYIFGVGKYGQMLFQLLQEFGITPRGFIDENFQGDELLGCEVFRRHQIKNKQSLIIISSLFFLPDFWNIFKSEGFQNVLPFTVVFALKDRFLDSKTVFGLTLEEYLLDVFINKDEYLKTLELFEDEESKEQLSELISFRETLDYDLFLGRIGNQSEIYFEKDLFEFSDNEVFLDCGGFVGDTSLDFIEKVGGKYKKIYIFEPCEVNMKQAAINLSSCKNIEFIKKGVSGENAVLGFSTTECNTVGAHVCENADSQIEVVTLDSVVKEPVTFVKFDIEGCENEGLLGAENIIKKHHPKLAISAYHKPYDIWELAQTIKRINPEYKLYFRSYVYARELILYAM